MLVGRAAERRTLEQLVAGARVGTSGVLLVTGEAGVGKSSLLAFTEQVAEGMTVLRAVGSATERDIPFAGLQQVLAPAVHLLDRIPSPQAEALGAALALRRGRVADRFTVGVATLSLVGRLAEEQPVAVLVDDAHWLDAATADALAFACRRLVVDPVVVVAVTRDVGRVGLARHDLPRLVLEGLDRTASRELLTRTYGEHLTRERMDELHRSTGGNPLAILELGAGRPRDPRSPAVPVALSRSLAEAFGGRAAELSARARQALLVAATEGGRLAVVLPAIRALGCEPDDLAEAERAGLVTIVADRVEFRHPLVRSAVYAEASPGERRESHRAVAGALRDAGGVLVSAGDREAWHRAESVVGPDAGVAEALERVAAGATARGAHDDAATAWERAARLSEVGAEATRRFLGAAESALLAGAPQRADVLLAAAAQHGIDDLHTRCRILALRGAVARHSGALRESRDLLLAAVDLVTREAVDPDGETAIPLLVDALYACFYLGDGRGAAGLARRLEQLLPWAREASTVHLGTLAAGVARVLAGESGSDQIRSAVAAFEADRALERDPQRIGWLVIGPLWLRESRGGRHLVGRVAGEARSRAAVATLPLLLFLLGRDDATTDRWALATANYTEALALARETGSVPDLIAALAGLAWLEARQGREAECREHVDEVLRECLPRRLDLFRVWALFALGELELGLGHPEQALATFQEIALVLDEACLADVDLSPVPEIADARLRLGRGTETQADADRLLAEAEAKGQPWALARAHRALALLAPEAEAERHFRLAQEHHAQTLDVFETARTSLAFGAWLRRSRHRVRSREPLRQALQVFEELGATPWADQAAAELAATGERVHRRETGGINELTPQQLQIAKLLASGRTSREAAAALFISRKTVEYHLRNVYLKLGISSRSELAEAMRR